MDAKNRRPGKLLLPTHCQRFWTGRMVDLALFFSREERSTLISVFGSACCSWELGRLVHAGAGLAVFGRLVMGRPLAFWSLVAGNEYVSHGFFGRRSLVHHPTQPFLSFIRAVIHSMAGRVVGMELGC